MEDKKGSEQLFVHGQKDVDLYVKNDRMESIDHDRHRIVTAAALEKIGVDYSLKAGTSVVLDARFKQKPVAFDQSKAKEIDESALK